MCDVCDVCDAYDGHFSGNDTHFPEKIAFISLLFVWRNKINLLTLQHLPAEGVHIFLMDAGEFAH